jgi:hypothetical protein
MGGHVPNVDPLHRSRAGRLLAVSALVLFSFAAHAAEPAKTSAVRLRQVEQRAKAAGIPAYRRKLGPGNEKIYLNASTPAHAAVLDELFGAKSNVLQIAHSGEPGSMHTMVLFDGEPIHIQYRGANWRLRRWWGPNERPIGHWLYTSLIELDPKEAAHLRTQIAKGRQQQGAGETAGPNWENGHLGDAFGARNYNCCSIWSELSVDSKGTPLWKKLGMTYGGGSPPDFQRRLETEANGHVFGHVVYGPRPIANFAKQPDRDRFTFAEPE